MLGAFSSEWVKLRRRAMLLWGLGGGLFFALIATIFTIERAVKNPGLFPLRRGRVSFYQLEMPTGLVHGVVDISTLIGIVALCLFAGAFATEFSQGTMRNLLVREPRRAQLLTGKFLAIAVFIGVAVVLEIVVSCAVAFILAPGRGITTSAWTSSTGINDLLQATLHVFPPRSATACSAPHWECCCARRGWRSARPSPTSLRSRGSSSARSGQTATAGSPASC
jgi:ABC-type transport system involved in multi-copper enzyme maturation permease subunit